MQTTFCIGNTRLNPGDNRIQGNVTMSCRTSSKSISTILYGVRGKAKVTRQCVPVGGLTAGSKVKYVESTAPGSFSSYVKDKKYFYNDLHELNLNEHGLAESSGGVWKFEKGANLTVDIDMELPNKQDLYLPSSYRDFGTKSPHYGELTIEYELVVLVYRVGAVLRRPKVDTFKKELSYQSGVQRGILDGDPSEYLKYIGQKHLKIKLPSNRSSTKGLPVNFQLNSKKLILLNKSLLDQINVHLYFDYSELNVHGITSKVDENTDLGILKIKSLELFVLYSSWFFCKGDEFQIDQSPKRLCRFEFDHLDIKINECERDKKSNTRIIEIPKRLLISSGAGQVPLLSMIKDTVMCTCDIDGLLKNQSSLKFIWDIEGPNNNLTFSFYTESTIDFNLEFAEHMSS